MAYIEVSIKLQFISNDLVMKDKLPTLNMHRKVYEEGEITTTECIKNGRKYN